MCEKIDNGISRVINNGTDVAIITNGEKAEIALKASRTLVVKGISTAIIETLKYDIIDEEIILNYADKTGAVIFIDKNIYDIYIKCVNKEETEVNFINNPTIENIINETEKTVQSKLINNRGKASSCIHYVH